MSELSIFELRQPRPGLITSGRIDPGQFDQLVDNGIRTVVNLCPHHEIPFDEQAEVESRGMKYVNIPVAGPGDLSADNARQLAQLTADASEPVLVHCQSSNRVGALFALAQAQGGADTDAAIEFGRSAGLSGLEPAVRQLLGG